MRYWLLGLAGGLLILLALNLGGSRDFSLVPALFGLAGLIFLVTAAVRHADSSSEAEFERSAARLEALIPKQQSIVIAEATIVVAPIDESEDWASSTPELAGEVLTVLEEGIRTTLNTDSTTFKVTLKAARRGSLEIDFTVTWAIIGTVGAALAAYPSAKTGLAAFLKDLDRLWSKKYRPLLSHVFTSSAVRIQQLRLMTEAELQEAIAKAEQKGQTQNGDILR